MSSEYLEFVLGMEKLQIQFNSTGPSREGRFAILNKDVGKRNSGDLWENLWAEISQVLQSKVCMFKHAFTTSLLSVQQLFTSERKMVC